MENKTLILVRHAKSSWDDAALSDFERPLNGRGKRDAPAMAKRLHDHKVKIDGFYSSPARRAKKTCKCFVEEYEAPDKDFHLVEKLYEAGEDDFYSVVTKADDRYNSIAIFSHNPGITDFVNQLSDTHIDNMPTCGAFAIAVACNSWSEFKNAKKEFKFFEFPKGGELD
jgi:phosphohistidine phosphatase